MPASKRQAAVASHIVRFSNDSDCQEEALPDEDRGSGSNGDHSGSIDDTRQTAVEAATHHVTLHLPILKKPHAVQPADCDSAAGDASQSSTLAAPLPRLLDAASPRLRPIRTALPVQPPPAATPATTDQQRHNMTTSTCLGAHAAVACRPSCHSRRARSIGSEGTGSRGRQAAAWSPVWLLICSWLPYTPNVIFRATSKQRQQFALLSGCRRADTDTDVCSRGSSRSSTSRDIAWVEREIRRQVSPSRCAASATMHQQGRQLASSRSIDDPAQHQSFCVGIMQ